MDLTFKTDEGRFNYRVCAVILHENKILAMHDERSPYYYLPGGRVNLHETAEAAVLRELSEELGVDASIIRPLWLNQSFFVNDVNGERFHELCIYFLIDVKDTPLLSRGEKFTVHERHHTLDFEWLDVNKLKDEYFYPLFLKEEIHRLPEALTLRTEFE